MQIQSDYILYAVPKGDFGDELHKYWQQVKGTELEHEYLRQYPPHVSLTGFFHSAMSEKQLITAVSQSVGAASSISKCAKRNGIVRKKGWHHIPLDSPFFREVTRVFAKSVSLNQNKIKSDHHITVCQKEFKNTWKNEKIVKLQDQMNVKATAQWYIALFKKSQSGKLTLCEEFKV